MRIFATSDDGKEIEIKKTEYVHIQVSPSAKWIIPHNLGVKVYQFPIYDTDGKDIEFYVPENLVTENQTVAQFKSATIGKAIIKVIG